MRLNLEITGKFKDILEDSENALADAIRGGVSAATKNLQGALRSQVRGAGLGNGLEKSWRMAIYPTVQRSLHPAGMVYSTSTFLHNVFISGAIITPKTGRYLAIPTAASDALGLSYGRTSRKGGTVTGALPRHYSQVELAFTQLGAINLRWEPSRRGGLLLIYTPPGTKQGVVLFIMKPQVRLTPKLDLDGAVRDAEADLANQLETSLGE